MYADTFVKHRESTMSNGYISPQNRSKSAQGISPGNYNRKSKLSRNNHSPMRMTAQPLQSSFKIMETLTGDII
jgi:hypothetical protein